MENTVIAKVVIKKVCLAFLSCYYFLIISFLTIIQQIFNILMWHPPVLIYYKVRFKYLSQLDFFRCHRNYLVWVTEQNYVSTSFTCLWFVCTAMLFMIFFFQDYQLNSITNHDRKNKCVCNFFAWMRYIFLGSSSPSN